jgi:hypothetical protein
MDVLVSEALNHLKSNASVKIGMSLTLDFWRLKDAGAGYKVYRRLINGRTYTRDSMTNSQISAQCMSDGAARCLDDHGT